MVGLKHIAFAALAAYAGVLAILFFAQRQLMYPADPQRVRPAEIGFAKAQEIELRASDGALLVAWYVAPEPGKAVVLYFHGNASNIANRTERFRLLTRDGTGLLALSYRGYGGSGGSPSESGLIDDARTAHAHLLKLGVAPERIVLYGESLGSGVAVALASEHKVAALVLEAPFSSASDVAASVYWMFPVRWLIRDPFDSTSRIGKIKAPVLILHGDADRVIPMRFGQRLYAAANEPRRFVAVPGGGHQVIEQSQVLRQVQAWIARYGESVER
jgi:uncharacterized protein